MSPVPLPFSRPVIHPAIPQVKTPDIILTAEMIDTIPADLVTGEVDIIPDPGPGQETGVDQDVPVSPENRKILVGIVTRKGITDPNVLI